MFHSWTWQAWEPNSLWHSLQSHKDKASNVPMTCLACSQKASPLKIISMPRTVASLAAEASQSRSPVGHGMRDPTNFKNMEFKPVSMSEMGPGGMGSQMMSQMGGQGNHMGGNMMGGQMGPGMMGGNMMGGQMMGGLPYV
ncbi:expressed unknown protein [Seminavis robusta]|uniref:Uncharacterized protein n=1 Tax=Seminavis robusta TaxID=568900 RepID=A0A9N8ENS9_9STRA|nr:expressed unknown protein [Seminavis robusta]|eukprot:Sro1302_g260920.1 n/a (140) ;mRNA; r:24564-24983